jgi:hypothetical protein
MYLTFLDHLLEMRKYQTRQEITSALQACDSGSILLDEDVDYAQEFYGLIFHLGFSNNRKLGIGICNQDHGWLPSLLLRPETSTIFLGFNNKAVGIQLPEGSILFTYAVEGLFVRFIPIYHLDMLLIQDEIGIAVIDFYGHEKWCFYQDIVIDLQILENQIILKFLDAPPVMLDIFSGRRI